jgi:hypothetical protein
MERVSLITRQGALKCLGKRYLKMYIVSAMFIKKNLDGIVGISEKLKKLELLISQKKIYKIV